MIVQPNKDLDNERRDKRKLIENNKDLDIPPTTSTTPTPDTSSTFLQQTLSLSFLLFIPEFTT